jgi:aspartate aminotransferase
MNNAGFPDVREAVARYLSKDSGFDMPASNIVMTGGAAGALNIVFKTIKGGFR